MRKLISFMHVSLDGFVAGLNGEMDWIHIDEEIFSYVGKRIGESDIAFYGRTTYRMMEDYWPDAGSRPGATKHDIEHAAWYKQVAKVVLSKTMNGVHLPNTTIISDHLSEQINEIKRSGNGNNEHMLVFGSPTATHSLMQHKLIDGYWLFVNPVVLGHGIPSFQNINESIKLKLISSRSFTSGVTELNYIIDAHRDSR